MIKREIDKGLILYQFGPRPGRPFGLNIYALLDEKQAIVIDCAFAEQAAAVRADLEAQGSQVTDIIISHWHQDHFAGLGQFDGARVLGNAMAELTLTRWTRPADRPDLTGLQAIDHEQTLVFGPHKLRLMPWVGHALCGLLIDINGEYLHVGDELMYSNDGQPLLPAVEPALLGAQINSLRQLKQLSGRILLPGHGPIVTSEAAASVIDSCLSYLQAVYASGSSIDYRDATRECSCDFLCQEWHGPYARRDE